MAWLDYSTAINCTWKAVCFPLLRTSNIIQAQKPLSQTDSALLLIKKKETYFLVKSLYTKIALMNKKVTFCSKCNRGQFFSFSSLLFLFLRITASLSTVFFLAQQQGSEAVKLTICFSHTMGRKLSCFLNSHYVQRLQRKSIFSIISS